LLPHNGQVFLPSAKEKLHMYPDLSYLFHDVFGSAADNWTSIFKTFGVFLVIAFLVAAWLLYLELKRKAAEGVFQPVKEKHLSGLPAAPAELISNGLIGFLIGFKGFLVAADFATFQRDPAGTIFSAKGNFVAGLVLAAVFAGWQWWEKNRKKLPKPREEVVQVYPHDRVGEITMMAAIGGILGAKIFAIFESTRTLKGFFEDPLGTFFSGSGLAIYGGLIGGFLAVLWFLRKHKISFWQVADAVAPALMIAYGVGRIGCQLTGDGDWGIEAGAMPSWWFLPEWMWSFEYPRNVNNSGVLMNGCNAELYKELFSESMSIEEKCMQVCGFRYCHQLDPGVFPTPFYETILAFIIGGILWILRKRIRVAGVLFFIYLIFNGFERFWIEKIRVNDKIDFGFMEATQAEIIAVLLFLIGIAGVVLLSRKQTKNLRSS
jgi:prolipoprotein diacylglyceryl transferase